MSIPSTQRDILKSIASSYDPDGRFTIVNNIQTFYKLSIPQQEEQNQNLQDVNNNKNDTSSDKPVILCLHQIMGSVYTWRYIMQPLANATGCHVLAYDCLPFGFTERPMQWEEGKNPYTQEALSEFILEFLSSVGYANRKVVFVGASSGTIISSHLSIKFPHIAFALIFIGPALRPQDQAPNLFIRKFLGTSLGRLVLKAFVYMSVPIKQLYNDVNSIPDWKTVVRPRYRLPLALPNFIKAFSFLLKYLIPLEILPNKDVLQKIPILYMTGDNDRYLSCNSNKRVFEELKSNSPSDSILEFKVIEQSGHLPHEEKPQMVIQSIVDFLRKLGV